MLSCWHNIDIIMFTLLLPAPHLFLASSKSIIPEASCLRWLCISIVAEASQLITAPARGRDILNCWHCINTCFLAHRLLQHIVFFYLKIDWEYNFRIIFFKSPSPLVCSNYYVNVEEHQYLSVFITWILSCNILVWLWMIELQFDLFE